MKLLPKDNYIVKLLYAALALIVLYVLVIPFKPTSIKTQKYTKDQTYIYELSVSGFGDWEVDYYGWHASGYLKREIVSKDDTVMPWGLVNIFDSNLGERKPSVSYELKSNKPLEYFGYPHVGYGAEDIKLLKVRKKYTVSGFSGVAKIYEFSDNKPRNKKLFKRLKNQGNSLGLLAIRLNKGKAKFETVLMFEHQNQPLEIADIILNEIKSDITIKEIVAK